MPSPASPPSGSLTKQIKLTRLPATSEPPGALVPKWRSVRYRLRAGLWLLIEPAVILATAVGVGAGYVVLGFTSYSQSIGEALLAGGLTGGGAAWAQAFSQQIRDRRSLQIQLASGAELEGADLAQVDLSGSYLRHRPMAGVRLSGAYCYETDFSGANLQEARLTNGHFAKSDFSGADLQVANCFNSDMRRTRLCQARLQGANLCKARLVGSDLSGADLRKADLRLADLTEANLDDADLAGSWYSAGTRWPANFVPPKDVIQLVDDRLGDEVEIEITAHRSGSTPS